MECLKKIGIKMFVMMSVIADLEDSNALRTSWKKNP